MALVSAFGGGKFSNVGAVVVAAAKDKIFALTCRKNHIDTTNSYFTLMTQANQCLATPPSDWRKGIVESRRLIINGADLHYEETGTGENFVLLLPGSLGSTRIDFGPQLRGLDKDKFTLVALDPRGYGKSIPPQRKWALEFFDKDVEDAVGLMKMMRAKKFDVLGYEDGGTVAVKLAARFPEFVNKLVVWGTSAFITEHDLSLTSNKWTDGMKLPVLDHYGEDYFKTNWNLRMNTLRQYWTERKGNICVDDLQKVTCDTLILHGSKDPRHSHTAPTISSQQHQQLTFGNR
ncbi:valacyclovir hydrolase-like isoform X2 [Liolophura sinensis]|uniref:valacyclovir hydrolase-like isoform X2 n=1 Tax=Liolophura sinensis TaxID=3198878 RepID=UPI003158EC28